MYRELERDADRGVAVEAGLDAAHKAKKSSRLIRQRMATNERGMQMQNQEQWEIRKKKIGNNNKETRMQLTETHDRRKTTIRD